MAKPKLVAQEWEAASGRDRDHSARLIRAQQVAGQSPIGVHGKAADLPARPLADFLLADVTGDAISTAAERTTLWSGLVRDRSFPSTTPATTEADKAFRNWKTKVDGGNLDPAASDDILPGPDLGSGIAAVLQSMSDSGFNIPFGSGYAPFTQIASHLGLSIELQMGGNEGPQAIVRCGRRGDRYTSKTSPSEKLRNARCPVESVVTIKVPHLVVFARLLTDTASHAVNSQPIPPTSPASPSGRGNRNAGAVPTAPALPEYQPDDDTRMDTGTTRKVGTLSSSDFTPRVCVSSIGIETPNQRTRTHDPYLLSPQHALL